MKTYQKDCAYSYALGAFPTFELIVNRPEKAVNIICHEKLVVNERIERLFDLARINSIPVETNSRLCEKLSPKENVYIIGVFNKFEMNITRGVNHIMLVNPSDMGNLGAVMRTALGFNIRDIAVVGEHADFFNPKAVRSSMGGFFSVNVQTFKDFSDYSKTHLNACYPFMLDSKKTLQSLTQIKLPYTLIFGNEASGLPAEYALIGEPLLIKHSDKIDSLNLPTAAALAMYQFDKLRD